MEVGRLFRSSLLLETVTTRWWWLGEVSPPILVQRLRFRLLRRMDLAVLQRVCYRAPLARGCVEGSSSSFPAVLWRRWSLEVVAVEVVGLEDLWGFLRKSAVL